MLSPKAKRNILRIIPFGLIWFVSNLIFFIVERAAMGGLDQHPSTGIEIDFKIFIFGTLANTVVGLLVGTMEILYLDKVFAKKVLPKRYCIKHCFTP